MTGQPGADGDSSGGCSEPVREAEDVAGECLVGQWVEAAGQRAHGFIVPIAGSSDEFSLLMSRYSVAGRWGWRMQCPAW